MPPQEAFEKLKQAMTSALILALPNFSKPFSLKTDICDASIRVVLSQEGKVIAFPNKALGSRNAGLPELMVILIIAHKWRHYL